MMSSPCSSPAHRTLCPRRRSPPRSSIPVAVSVRVSMRAGVRARARACVYRTHPRSSHLLPLPRTAGLCSNRARPAVGCQWAKLASIGCTAVNVRCMVYAHRHGRVKVWRSMARTPSMRAMLAFELLHIDPTPTCLHRPQHSVLSQSQQGKSPAQPSASFSFGRSRYDADVALQGTAPWPVRTIGDCVPTLCPLPRRSPTRRTTQRSSS
jgi:hypothetical protein